MKHYEIVPHTADVGLRVEGTTLEELFNAALQGMSQIIASGTCELKNDVQIDVSLSSNDATSLLIDFLSDILTQSHVKKVVFCRVEFKILHEKELCARVYGVNVKHFDEDIKAVTYHEADVCKNKLGNWETMIIFDI